MEMSTKRRSGRHLARSVALASAMSIGLAFTMGTSAFAVDGGVSNVNAVVEADPAEAPPPPVQIDLEPEATTPEPVVEMPQPESVPETPQPESVEVQTPAAAAQPASATMAEDARADLVAKSEDIHTQSDTTAEGDPAAEPSGSVEASPAGGESGDVADAEPGDEAEEIVELEPDNGADSEDADDLTAELLPPDCDSNALVWITNRTDQSQTVTIWIDGDFFASHEVPAGAWYEQYDLPDLPIDVPSTITVTSSSQGTLLEETVTRPDPGSTECYGGDPEEPGEPEVPNMGAVATCGALTFTNDSKWPMTIAYGAPGTASQWDHIGIKDPQSVELGVGGTVTVKTNLSVVRWGFWIPLSNNPFVGGDVSVPQNCGPGTEKPTAGLNKNEVGPGGTLTITGERFIPGETVKLELHSAPVSLGAAVVGTDGMFTENVVIPAGTTAGAHEVWIIGAETTIKIPITVLGSATGGGGTTSPGAGGSGGASAGSGGATLPGESGSGGTGTSAGGAVLPGGASATPGPGSLSGAGAKPAIVAGARGSKLPVTGTDAAPLAALGGIVLLAGATLAGTARFARTRR